MKTLILIFGLFIAFQASGQIVRDTIARDTITQGPIIGGIVKLNTENAGEGYYYSVAPGGVYVYLIYKVQAIHVGVFRLEVQKFFFSKADHPVLHAYVTDPTVKNYIEGHLITYFENNPVEWNQFIYIDPDE